MKGLGHGRPHLSHPLPHTSAPLACTLCTARASAHTPVHTHTMQFLVSRCDFLSFRNIVPLLLCLAISLFFLQDPFSLTPRVGPSLCLAYALTKDVQNWTPHCHLLSSSINGNPIFPASQSKPSSRSLSNPEPILLKRLHILPSK